MKEKFTPDQRSQRATAELEPVGFGPVVWVPEVSSTNEELLDQARGGLPHGSILVADYQSRGQGRNGRIWTAEPNHALLASVLLRPKYIPVEEFSTVISAVAIGAVEACHVAGFSNIEIKWPNDLVVAKSGSYRKLAGVLAQSVVSPTSSAVVVGIGLNVIGGNFGDLHNVAVALDDLGPAPDRTDLLISIVHHLASWLNIVENSGRNALWARYRELCPMLGRKVRVDVNGSIIEGVAIDVSETGALLLDTNDGCHELFVGDVSALREI